MPSVFSAEFSITLNKAAGGEVSPDSPLKTFAAGLAPGQLAEYTNFASEGMPANWIKGSGLAWSNRLLVDPIRHIIWVPHMAHEDNGIGSLMKYDIVAATWTRPSVMSGYILGRNNGHQYGSVDVDWATGAVMWTSHGRQHIAHFSPGANYNGAYPGGTYSNSDPDWPIYNVKSNNTNFDGFSSTNPPSNAANQPQALVYHPNLFGAGQGGTTLSWVGPSSSSSYGCVMINKTTQSYITPKPTFPGSVTGGPRHGVGAYSSVLDAAVVSQGDNSRVMYKIAAGGTITRLQDAPTGYAPSANPSSTNDIAKLVDGPSGIYIFGNRNGDRCYRLNDATLQWTDTGVDVPWKAVYNRTQYNPGWIPQYGVYVAILPASDSTSYGMPKMYVWKPPVGF